MKKKVSYDLICKVFINNNLRKRNGYGPKNFFLDISHFAYSNKQHISLNKLSMLIEKQLFFSFKCDLYH